MGIYSYKTQMSAGGKRIQNIEETFAKGMQFTNTPLLEGLLKTIVNFDIHDLGASLVPRPGLRTTQAYTGAGSATSQIIHSEEVAVGDDTWSLFQTKEDLPIGLRYVDAPFNLLYGSTINKYATEGEIEFSTSELITYPHALYNVPITAEVHGVPISDPSNTMAKQVGVTAWNNNRYFFDAVNRKVVHTEWDAATSAFKFVANDPKVVNSKEAVSWGYNMLQANPYTFTDEAGGAGSIMLFTGMLPYDAAGQLCMAPVVNQTIEFRVFYQVFPTAKYHIVWEWRSASGQVWTKLAEGDTTFNTPLARISTVFSPPEEGVIIRVSAYGFTGEVQNVTTDATLAVGFSFNKEDYGSTANTQPKTYSVVDAKGMTYWNNKLVVWNVPEDPTMIFASDVNDPTYFPYPNNTDSFEEPVKYAIPFLDYLLVFTSSKLYLLTQSPDGLGWTTRCIQNNLTISDWDIHLIQIVKNMVFFRSGNYYYMIVPKSGSGTGELTLAPVSKPMYGFFDHFSENVREVILETHNYSGALTLIHYYNYLDFEDVHNVYVFKTDTDEYINFCLLYNTVDRSWRCYTLGSQSIMLPYKADATQRGTLCSAGGDTNLIPQLLKFSNTNHADFYIPLETTLATYPEDFAAIHDFKNWQYLDTGYREHSSNFKKRYRELQFVINNISNKALKFYTDFYIDGEARKERYSYSVVQELDINSPNYGIITIERALEHPLIAPSTTMLGDDQDDETGWELGVSMFPEVSFWKARQPVSGKGYTPRFFLISQNEDAYELLNISWVYKALYSR